MRQIPVDYFFYNAFFYIFSYYIFIFNINKFGKSLVEYVLFKETGKFLFIKPDGFKLYPLKSRNSLNERVSILNSNTLPDNVSFDFFFMNIDSEPEIIIFIFFPAVS